MNRKSVALLVLVVLMGIAFVPAVAAGPPELVSGTWQWTSFIEPNKYVGGNLFFTGYEYTIETGWSGGFEGISFDTFRGVFHKFGDLNYRITINFVGTVLGSETGAMVLELVGVGFADGSAHGSWIVASSDVGLEGLQGEGKFWMKPGDTLGSYSGKVHWQK